MLLILVEQEGSLFVNSFHRFILFANVSGQVCACMSHSVGDDDVALYIKSGMMVLLGGVLSTVASTL